MVVPVFTEVNDVSKIGFLALGLVLCAATFAVQSAENETPCKNGPSAKVAEVDLTADLNNLDACDALIAAGFADLSRDYERRGNIYVRQL
jgi:hypothetical protein